MFGKLPSSSLSNLRTPLNTLVPKQVISQLNWTDLWRRRIISNFEYLMRLNILAGRSFNDIGQYPVFPWVLCDFKSSSINLHDPSVYRDLSKPIGALNPVRLEEFRDRFDSFDPDDHTRFMYGSHYSSAGIVLYYLIRQEPFTMLNVNLQGGRFDVPDRIFFNMEYTWNGCNTHMSDVKELVPEMYLTKRETAVTSAIKKIIM